LFSSTLDIDKINVLNVGRNFEMSAEISGYAHVRHEIDYHPISNFEMGLMSPKFRPILWFQNVG